MPKRIYHCDRCGESTWSTDSRVMLKARLQRQSWNGRKWVPDGPHAVIWLCPNCGEIAEKSMKKPVRKRRARGKKGR